MSSLATRGDDWTKTGLFNVGTTASRQHIFVLTCSSSRPHDHTKEDVVTISFTYNRLNKSVHAVGGRSRYARSCIAWIGRISLGRLTGRGRARPFVAYPSAFGQQMGGVCQEGSHRDRVDRDGGRHDLAWPECRRPFSQQAAVHWCWLPAVAAGMPTAAYNSC
ncbi:hypothetical protein LZ32DRAFT_237145 [Colletotrichum eremochloae]|nr:hypothetical protein LZ32DRAFT_237145 [Colletotrichum eremochloae]